KIETVRDDYSDIRNSVVGLSKTYDIVITSGGVGPTHDDITYDAVARAFGKSLEHHQPTLARMRDLMTRIMAKSRIEAVLPDPNGTPEQIACARMALIPQDSQVEFPSANLWVPLVTVNENVHVLPGVPKIFEQMVDDGLDGLIRRARDRRRARHQEEDQLPHESAASVMASRGEAVEDLRAQSFH
ncbi:3-hydroxyanthranilic acid dioxygenase, partial [Spiromyces aspiralis]